MNSPPDSGGVAPWAPGWLYPGRQLSYNPQGRSTMQACSDLFSAITVLIYSLNCREPLAPILNLIECTTVRSTSGAWQRWQVWIFTASSLFR
jgi:hypothetical protein